MNPRIQQGLRPMTPEFALYAIWTVWLLLWVALARMTKRAAARTSFWREAPYLILTVAGFAFLFRYFSTDPGAPYRLYTLAPATGWAFVALGGVAFLFALWARLTMGGNWSGSVMRKEEHALVTRGPFRFVRHPIYTGLIAGAIALAAVKGLAFSWLGAALIALGCFTKARLEERLMRETFGGEYENYARKTPMLIPFTRGEK